MEAPEAADPGLEVDGDQVGSSSRWQAVRPPSLPKFSGEDAGEADQFILEARRILQNYKMDPGTATEWVIQALGGMARQEILGRPYEEVQTPDKILDILAETFGDRRGVSTLLSLFHSRRQGPNEGVLQYAQALQQLSGKLNRLQASTITDTLLRDRFTEGLSLQPLRRDVRRYLRETEGVTFHMARTEAQRWMREDCDGDGASLEQISTQTPDQLAQLMKKVDLLLESQAERDRKIQTLQDENRRLFRQVSSQQQIGSRGPPRRRAPPGACFICLKQGHKQAECPEKRQPTPATAAQGNEQSSP
jgi:hypothetical protein